MWWLYWSKLLTCIKSLTHSLLGSPALWQPWPLNYRCPCCPISCFLFPFLNFISQRSFSTSSSHLNLGLPFLLLPSSFLSNIFVTVLPWSILTTCPIHSSTCHYVYILTQLFPCTNLFLLTNIDDCFAGRHCRRQKQPLCSEGCTQLLNQRNKSIFVRIWACIAVHLNRGAGSCTFVVYWK